MMECVSCGYRGFEFNARIAGNSQGAFTYVAECPKCSSRMVKHLPGYFESDLRIRLEGRRPITFRGIY